MSALNFHVAILAGGRSSRMGSDKRFIELGGESILDRAIRIARSWGPASGRVMLCGAVEGYSCLRDQIPGQGPLGGLFSAVLELRKSAFRDGAWLVLMPVDMPKISHCLLDVLIQPVVIASVEQREQIEGMRFEGFELPCLFKVTPRLEEVLLKVLSEASPSDRSIRKLLDQLHSQSVALAPDDADCMANVNTPEDLVRVRSQL